MPPMLHKSFTCGVPETLEDVAVDFVAHWIPALEWSGERTFLRQPNPPVNRHPTHDARIEKLEATTAHLPNAFVSLLPVLADPINQPHHIHPHIITTVHGSGGGPAPRTFPTWFPLFALDRIWAKPKEVLDDVYVHSSPLARIASDHLPVAATLHGIEKK